MLSEVHILYLNIYFSFCYFWDKSRLIAALNSRGKVTPRNNILKKGFLSPLMLFPILTEKVSTQL